MASVLLVSQKQTVRFSSPEKRLPFLPFFAFLGSPLLSTSQAKKIFFCWGPNSSPFLRCFIFGGSSPFFFEGPPKLARSQQGMRE